MLTVLTAREWTLLAEVLRTRPDAVVVALLDPPSLSTSLRALGAGAAGVLARDAAPSLVRFAFRAAVEGVSLLPVGVARALAASIRSRIRGR